MCLENRYSAHLSDGAGRNPSPVCPLCLVCATVAIPGALSRRGAGSRDRARKAAVPSEFWHSSAVRTGLERVHWAGRTGGGGHVLPFIAHRNRGYVRGSHLDGRRHATGPLRSAEEANVTFPVPGNVSCTCTSTMYTYPP